MNDLTPTPSGPADEIDGRDQPCAGRREGRGAHRAGRPTRAKPFYELHYPFSEDDFPGGPRTVCLALTLRMQQLVGMPVPADERGGPTEERRGSGNAVDRLAASIEILEPAEVLH